MKKGAIERRHNREINEQACSEVLRTCKMVTEQQKQVTVDETALESFVYDL